jgi:hypothetical protein
MLPSAATARTLGDVLVARARATCLSAVFLLPAPPQASNSPSSLQSSATPSLPSCSPSCLSSSNCCCPLAPANRSAPGLATNICDVVVEEGGPRVEAKRRGGDPIPRAGCRAKSRERAGSGLFVLGIRPIDEYPDEHPRDKQVGVTTSCLPPGSSLVLRRVSLDRGRQ